MQVQRVLVVRTNDDKLLQLAADTCRAIGCAVEEVVIPEPVCDLCGKRQGELVKVLGGGTRVVELVGPMLTGRYVCLGCLAHH